MTEPDSGSESRRAAVVTGTFLILHFAGLAGLPRELWGVDLLVDAPRAWRLAFLGLAVVVGWAAWKLPRRGRGPLLPAALDPWGTRASAARFGAALAVLGGALFLLFRAATNLLGDGQLLVRVLRDSMPLGGWANDNAPLTYGLARAFYLLTGPAGRDATAVYRTLGVVSGIAFLLLALGLSRSLGRTRGDRAWVFGLLITGGYLPLFFGYVETYPLHLSVVLLYLAVGLASRQRPLALWGAAVLAGVAIPLHLSLVALVPSLAVLAWTGPDRREGESGPGPGFRLVRGGGALVLAVAVAMGILLAIGLPLGELFRRSSTSHLLPLFAEPGFVHPYRLLAPAHFRDLLSHGLLVAPGAVMAFLVRPRPRGGRAPGEPFLLAATLFPWLFVALANPEIGAFRDWDALAFPAVPLTLWAAVRFRRADRRPAERLGRSARLILAASGLHTLLWIGVNADAAVTERRFARLLEDARLSAHARSYGWESLGRRRLELGPRDVALDCYERAAAADPSNPRHRNWTGLLRFERGEIDRAIADFLRAVELDPGFASSRYNLGLAYARLGRFEEAVRAFQAAVERDGGNADAHFQLGVAFGEVDRWEEAARTLERAVALGPDRPWAAEAAARARAARERAPVPPPPTALDPRDD